MEREVAIKKVDSILERIEVIDKEREALVEEIKEILPIKINDKVNVCDRDGDKFVRFAFVNKIEVNLRGKERNAKIEFDLQKCKADGKPSQHADSLRVGEYITRIK